MEGIEKSTIRVRQPNVPNEGVLHVSKAQVAVGLSMNLFMQLLNLGHLGMLAEKLLNVQCSGKFKPFELRLVMIGSDSVEADEEGIEKLAEFLAAHLTAKMKAELICKLQHY